FPAGIIDITQMDHMLLPAVHSRIIKFASHTFSHVLRSWNPAAPVTEDDHAHLLVREDDSVLALRTVNEWMLFVELSVPLSKQRADPSDIGLLEGAEQAAAGQVVLPDGQL